MIFETPRVHVRHLEAGDVDALLAVYGDAETMAPLGDDRVLSRDDCAQWVDVTARNVARRGYGMSAVELRGSSDVIGFCGLVHPGDQQEAELKYALRRDHWGRGFGSEVAAAMLAHGRAAFGLRRIIATVAPGNIASRQVLTKIGMEHERTLHDDDGDVELYAWSAPG